MPSQAGPRGPSAAVHARYQNLRGEKFGSKTKNLEILFFVTFICILMDDNENIGFKTKSDPITICPFPHNCAEYKELWFFGFITKNNVLSKTVLNATR